MVTRSRTFDSGNRRCDPNCNARYAVRQLKGAVQKWVNQSCFCDWRHFAKLGSRSGGTFATRRPGPPNIIGLLGCVGLLNAIYDWSNSTTPPFRCRRHPRSRYSSITRPSQISCRRRLVSSNSAAAWGKDHRKSDLPEAQGTGDSVAACLHRRRCVSGCLGSNDGENGTVMMRLCSRPCSSRGAGRCSSDGKRASQRDRYEAPMSTATWRMRSVAARGAVAVEVRATIHQTATVQARCLFWKSPAGEAGHAVPRGKISCGSTRPASTPGSARSSDSQSIFPAEVRFRRHQSNPSRPLRCTIPV